MHELDDGKNRIIPCYLLPLSPCEKSFKLNEHCLEFVVLNSAFDLPNVASPPPSRLPIFMDVQKLVYAHNFTITVVRSAALGSMIIDKWLQPIFWDIRNDFTVQMSYDIYNNNHHLTN